MLYHQTRFLLVAGVLIVGSLGGCAAQSPEGAAPRQRGVGEPGARSISTSGTSTLYVKPDEVTVRFSVESRDPDLAKAKAANDAASRAALTSIKSLQIEDRDVQSKMINSGRDFEKMPDGHQRFVGYIVEREYAVKVRQLQAFEPLMELLLARPEYTGQEYEFGTKDRDKVLERARQQAVKTAHDRAVLLAKELGCGIGEPSQIHDSSSDYRSGGGSLFGGGGGSDAGEISVTPLGEIAISATVDVTFDLIPPRR